MKGLVSLLFGGSLLFFAASPSSTNYNLRSYDFGNGGTDNSSSTNYKLNGDTNTGEGSGSSTTYKLGSGLNPTENDNVPPAPTLTNPDGYYDRLKLVLATGGNPTDTKYLIAISPDNFVTTYYVQTDNSIGASYTITTYQTYTSWGGASGFYITGLSQSTTYKVKIRAIQGRFSESAYGPVATASTVAPSLSFGVTTTLTSTPPFAVSFASLTAGSVFDGDADGTIVFSTNAKLGGSVYISSKNAALSSASAGSSIASSSADLASANTGYGAQVTSATQSIGGPISIVAPFNVAAQNVGGLATAFQPLLTSSAPTFGVNANLRFKARSDAATTAATDYTDTVTLVAAMNY